MEKVFHPDERKWISPLTKLGEAMEELKRLVRLQRDSLLVKELLDPKALKADIPVLAIKPAADEVPNAANANQSENQNQSQGQGQNQGESFEPSQERPNLSNPNVDHPYLNIEASELQEGDVVAEDPAESEKIKEQLESKSQRKWLVTDEACAAAVASIGGPDFFDMKAKKKRRKKKNKGRGRGRGRKNTEDYDDEDDDDDDDFEDENWADSTIFQRYNYGGIKEEQMSQAQPNPQSQDNRDDPSMSTFFDLSQMFPDAFTFTEAEINDLQIEDDDFGNYANWADKYEEAQQRYDGLLNDSDLEDDDNECNKFSDEEDEEGQGQDVKFELMETEPVTLRGSSQSDSLNTPPHTSAAEEVVPMTLRQKTKKNVKSNKLGKLNLSNTLEPEGIFSDLESNVSSSQAAPETEPEPTASTSQSQPTAEEAQDFDDKSNEAELFKRFTDWVFDQSKKRDKEEMIKARPELMKKFNMTEKEISDLQRVTSASLATVKGEVFQDDPVMKATSMPVLAPPIDLSGEQATLQSLAIFITHGDDPSNFPWKSINVQQQMNDDFVHEQFVRRMEQQKIDCANPAMKDELVNKEEDFLVQVLVYQATDPTDILPDEIKTYIEPKLAYELHMLGSQTVKDLMDAIHCENDYIYLKDVPHPSQFEDDPNEYAKKKFPSRMMLIQDKIFSDPSAPGVDYSAILNNWASKPPQKHIGPFFDDDWTKKMKDLELRFGMPYLYTHLGGCEHIIVFTKARLLHLEDEHLKKNYPKIIGIPRFKNVYCRVDNEYLARWSVQDYKEFPENPMLLCTECVLMYCYDKQKKKQGDFKLYPFTQIANVI